VLRTQKAVMANLDRRVSGGHMRRTEKQYRTGIVEPLVEVLKSSQSGAEVLRRLNVDLFRRMNATALIEAVADANMQSAMKAPFQGRLRHEAAEPRSHVRTKEKRHRLPANSVRPRNCSGRGLGRNGSAWRGEWRFSLMGGGFRDVEVARTGGRRVAFGERARRLGSAMK